MGVIEGERTSGVGVHGGGERERVRERTGVISSSVRTGGSTRVGVIEGERNSSVGVHAGGEEGGDEKTLTAEDIGERFDGSSSRCDDRALEPTIGRLSEHSAERPGT